MDVRLLKMRKNRQTDNKYFCKNDTVSHLSIIIGKKDDSGHEKKSHINIDKKCWS